MKEDIGLAGTDRGLKQKNYGMRDGYYDSTFNEHPVEWSHVEEISKNPAGTVDLLRNCHLQIGHIWREKVTGDHLKAGQVNNRKR